QPAAYRIPPGDGRGFAGQDQEGGLEDVVGGVGVTQHRPAHTQHHRPMPLDEGSERPFVPLAGKPFEQLAIRQLRLLRRTGDSLNMLNDRVQLAVWHGSGLPWAHELSMNAGQEGGKIQIPSIRQETGASKAGKWSSGPWIPS